MKLPCNCEMGFWQGRCVCCGAAIKRPKAKRLDFWGLIALLILFALLVIFHRTLMAGFVP